ncbi:MAG: RsmD family RNA methyltransferase [Candidatus Saccharimonadales bacterium]
MRVIAGSLGGRPFESPHGHRTHPMAEKVRGAIFGVLGDIQGLTVLDIFSGSGAVAIEAISRGAASALCIEVDKGAHTIIDKNIASLGIEDKVTTVRAFYNAWSTRHQAQLFDLVFADPPFDHMPWRDMKIIQRHVNDTGLLVLNWPGKAEWPAFTGMEMIDNRSYGDTQLVFYRRIK